MREIKFRAWDSSIEDGQMVYSDMHNRDEYDVQYYFYFDESGKVVCSWEEDFDDGAGYPSSHGGMLTENIMQYTGLKDKNGVEIFEGDIIKLSYLSPLDNKEKVSLYRVEEMQNGYYAIKEVTDKQRGDSGLFLHFKRCEVIGNIYDNPELLEARDNV